jgi:hypothetical protein
MNEPKMAKTLTQSPCLGSFLPKNALMTNAKKGKRKIGAMVPIVYCMD